MRSDVVAGEESCSGAAEVFGVQVQDQADYGVNRSRKAYETRNRGREVEKKQPKGKICRKWKKHLPLSTYEPAEVESQKKAV